jgi:hypothetical protein
VRAGLRALQERDAAVERWLKDEVIPTYDAMKADPSQGIPAKAVFAEVHARHSRHNGASLNRRTVIFAPQARHDLVELTDWIAERAGARTPRTS